MTDTVVVTEVINKTVVVEETAIVVDRIIEVVSVGIQGPPGAGGGGGGSGETFAKLTTSTTLTSANTNTRYTNEGAASLVVVTLPAAAEGLKFTFLVTASAGFTIDAAGSNTIRIGTGVTSAGGTYTSTKVGSSIVIYGTDTAGWVASSALGIWSET